MNFSDIIVKVGMQLKKYSPEILVTVGVAGTVATTVVACKATTKAAPILEEAKKDVDLIHAAAKYDTNEELYSEKMQIKISQWSMRTLVLSFLSCMDHLLH